MLGTTALTPVLLCVPVLLPLIAEDCTSHDCKDYDTIHLLSNKDAISTLILESAAIRALF